MELNRILVTGAFGFLGRYFLSGLANADIKTLGRTSESDYCVDLSREIPTFKDSFDCVIHVAGKAHSVPKTKEDAQMFFDVNLQGTINLCKGLERSGVPKSFVFISTVAVYGLDEGNDITEEYPLLGKTPYALSKIQAEFFLRQWCSKHQVILGIIRPSLIAGEVPPGNLGAMIQGIRNGYYFSIAGGKARKSVVMAEDIVRIIPILTEKGGTYNLCDNHNPSFRELEILIANQLTKSNPVIIPYWIANLFAKFGDIFGNRSPINTMKLNKITHSLTFSNQRARTNLNWEPLDVLSCFKIKK